MSRLRLLFITFVTFGIHAATAEWQACYSLHYWLC